MKYKFPTSFGPFLSIDRFCDKNLYKKNPRIIKIKLTSVFKENLLKFWEEKRKKEEGRKKEEEMDCILKPQEPDIRVFHKRSL